MKELPYESVRCGHLGRVLLPRAGVITTPASLLLRSPPALAVRDGPCKMTNKERFIRLQAQSWVIGMVLFLLFLLVPFLWKALT
ncbi:hypothetical protein [Nocardioides ungokensis]|uniref:hypothetical protein n=1 Tax=Nocardioides ungokensis TaxID=1643322 RepID=UPI0015DD7B61|nr:hypothetical protein [Nocardioides ungokensis]